MSSLRDQFDRIDHERIRQFVDDREQETLHLEFKTLGGGQKLGRDDRKNLAKAISGFANSDGGIVVWGVEAKKVDEIDAATKLYPIDEVARAYAEINNYTGKAATPIVDDVDHKMVERADGSGFIVTLVPQSESTPHMAKLGEDRYYKRSGDSFYKMEHFDLEDMFGRRCKPKLSLQTRIEHAGKKTGGGQPTYNKVEIVIGIVNSGKGLARLPALSLRQPAGPYTPDYPSPSTPRGLPLVRLVSSRGNEAHFAGGAHHVIHAGTELEVTRVSVQVAEQETQLPDLRLVYRIAAEGIKLVEGEKTIPGRDILCAANQSE